MSSNHQITPPRFFAVANGKNPSAWLDSLRDFLADFSYTYEKTTAKKAKTLPSEGRAMLSQVGSSEFVSVELDGSKTSTSAVYLEDHGVLYYNHEVADKNSSLSIGVLFIGAGRTQYLAQSDDSLVKANDYTIAVVANEADYHLVRNHIRLHESDRAEAYAVAYTHDVGLGDTEELIKVALNNSEAHLQSLDEQQALADKESWAPQVPPVPQPVVNELDRDAVMAQEALKRAMTSDVSVVRVGEVRTTSETGGMKGVKPQRFDLLPTEAMSSTAVAFSILELNGVDVTALSARELFNRISHHINRFWGGEHSADTGVEHLPLATAYAMAALALDPSQDNRAGTLASAAAYSAQGWENSDVERFDLIPPAVSARVAEHYGVGARKYADNNWRLGYKWSNMYAALNRHLDAWFYGEDTDEETGSPHLAGVLFHLLGLQTQYIEHPHFDDRYKPEN